MNSSDRSQFSLDDFIRLETELRDLNVYCRAIVDSARQSFITLDKDLRVHAANRWFYETFHVCKDETVGKPFYELGNGQWNIPKLRELLEDCLPSQTVVKDYKVDHYFEHIGQRTMIINACKLNQKAGKDLLVLLVIDDITERHRSEEQLKIFSEELKRSNFELEQFAQIASHDIQEPLTIVNNYVQLLQKKIEKEGDQSSDRLIDIIDKEIKYIQSLVKGLLNYSKIDQSDKPFGKVDCNACLEKALAILQIVIKEADAHVTSERLPAIMGDEILITRLFQNLISNAIKFKGRENPRIRIKALQKNNQWEISVTDNGIGIAPENFEKVFGIFNRVNKQYPGSGIGLSECRKIVELHGGKIMVYSELGEGSTFSLYFPDSLNLINSNLAE